MKIGDRFTETRGMFTTMYVCTREGREVDCCQVLTFWKGRPVNGHRPEKEFCCTKGCEGMFGIASIDAEEEYNEV